MNETVFQSHYRAMTDDPPRGRIHSPKREEKEVGRARKVHKAICAAISRKGVSSAISDKALFLSRCEPVPESVTRALRNYQGFVEDEALPGTGEEADAVSKVLRATQGSSGGGYPCGPYWVDERDMDALRKAYGR